jgi:hypothetical protein
MTRIDDEPWKHRHPAWEPVDHSEVTANVWITTRRLSVTSGWLYMVTAWDRGHLGVAVCFVPEQPVVENMRTD